MERFGQNEELVLEFPCDFIIKIAGRRCEEFPARIGAILCQHDESFTPETRMTERSSSTGKFQSLTVTLRATSKAHIDAVYQDLKACELVLWAL